MGIANTYVGSSGQVGSKVILDSAVDDTTFLFRDHFSRPLNTTDWVVSTGAGGSQTDDTTNHLCLLNTAALPSSTADIYTKTAQSLTVSAVEIVARFKVSNSAQGYLIGLTDGLVYANYLGLVNASATQAKLRTCAGGVTTNSGNFDITPTDYNKIRITATTSSVSVYLNNSATASATNTTNIPTAALSGWMNGNGNGVYTASMDYFALRRTLV